VDRLEESADGARDAATGRDDTAAPQMGQGRVVGGTLAVAGIVVTVVTLGDVMMFLGLALIVAGVVVFFLA
jgi:hypothetical protein